MEKQIVDIVSKSNMFMPLLIGFFVGYIIVIEFEIKYYCDCLDTYNFIKNLKILLKNIGIILLPFIISIVACLCMWNFPIIAIPIVIVLTIVIYTIFRTVEG